MALERLPAYVRAKPLAGGKKAYYWELPHWAKPPALKHGKTCPLQSTPLGLDLATAIQKGDNLNEALAEWRKGEGGKSLVRGTVAWLFGWYRKQDRFLKNAAKTRSDYGKLMEMLIDFETKAGRPPLGKQSAARVDASVADKLYQKLRTKGDRQASYAMQVCRLVWSWAVRHHRVTGVKENPFLGMGLVSAAKKGNRATARSEYDAYRAKARELGFQSMATAAALGFEGCQRTWDVFGYEDPDGEKHRGFRWADYQAETISLVQSKTGRQITLPLSIAGDRGERIPLYPHLEEELARSAQVRRDGGELIVVEERSGKPYRERRMSSVHRAICEAAGLPKDMTFTGFRHGGITEVGSVTADVRPISGHATLDVTRIYNKVTADKAREIGALRRAHVQLIAEADETGHFDA